MPVHQQIRRLLLIAGVLLTGALVTVGVRTFLEFRPAAITLGPNTTIYFNDDPPLATRVHEAIHRRQMWDKSVPGRIVSAIRYNFDYQYRLDEEAEAKAGEICLQIHKFSDELPAYTTARSRSQAEAYRAWAWERIGVSVADRVGERLGNGQRCHQILQGVVLDLPPGEDLTEEESLKLAAFRFLQSYGSSETEVAKWKARLELAGWAEPTRVGIRHDLPPFWLVDVARGLAAPPDTSVDETEAGEALHRLTYYRARRMYTQLLPPLPGYRHRPLLDPTEAEDRTGLPLPAWPEALLERALQGGLDGEALSWLREMAAHPLHRDFETFARAPEADVVGTRYRFPADVEWERLVLTELGPVREAFHAQWGRAALALAEEDLDGARAILATVLAGSLQVARNAPFEVDVVEALDVMRFALLGLARIAEVGEGSWPEWAERLEGGAPEVWSRGHRAALFSEDPAVVFRALPRIASDETIPHAFKRFAYRQVVLFDVCLGLRIDRASRRDHREWRSAVEAGLVRRESDREVLEMMRRGVQELVEASDVAPESICAPSVVVRPRARYAIMSSPLRSASRLRSSVLAGDLDQNE